MPSWWPKSMKSIHQSALRCVEWGEVQSLHQAVGLDERHGSRFAGVFGAMMAMRSVGHLHCQDGK